MNGQLKTWLDGELKEYEALFQEFRRKVKKNVPLWMALSVVLLVSFGVLGGGIDNLSETLPNILKINLPVGCGIAAFIWLCFWIQGKSASMKKVQDAYEKGIDQFLKRETDQELFCKQMKEGNYGTVNFLNTKTESYPTRFIAGPDYWVHFSSGFCRFIRTEDIEKIYGTEETSRVSYNAGNKRVSQNVAVGVSLVIVYRDGSLSAKDIGEREERIFFQSGNQFRQALDMIAAHCPRYGSWH